MLNNEIEKNPSKEKYLIDQYVLKHFALPQAHSRAMASYKGIGGFEKAKYHEWMFRGLMLALMRSGNGETPDSAFKVLTLSEEYMLARRIIDKKTQHQELENINGRVYDVLSGKHIKTSKQIKMWFDITEIFARYP